MESSTEKIIRLLLTYPKKTWKQIDLSKYAKCSKPFVNKLVKKFISEGILVETENKKIKLLSFSKLLNIWCNIR
ncbi:MAG: hypothetical protein J7K26_02645, partial [Candidatus Aenigmarchaeota archaeon]|nr:hypothetical protein [Candidatus Aenigmarchaeota archaeon]